MEPATDAALHITIVLMHLAVDGLMPIYRGLYADPNALVNKVDDGQRGEARGVTL